MQAYDANPRALDHSWNVEAVDRRHESQTAFGQILERFIALASGECNKCVPEYLSTGPRSGLGPGRGRGLG